ncbi:hypothetical protein AcV7_006509 [Taiwanofungus camphoratus]|nr:hypothetical protein AcV7_006509 [Antrodia cinnamomea]
MPLWSSLLPSVTSAYGLQTALALIFVPQANEKFYDLGGALGFLSTGFVSLYYPYLKAKFWDKVPLAKLPALSSFAPRQLLLNAALVAWSTRLGSFLVTRALKAGGDSRFDEVKRQPAKFTAFWIGQATWVFIVGLPIYMVNTLPAAVHPPLGRLDYASLVLFAGSWLFEIRTYRDYSWQSSASIWRIYSCLHAGLALFDPPPRLRIATPNTYTYTFAQFTFLHAYSLMIIL